MKKIIFSLSLLVGVLAAKSQSVTMNVNLADVKTITVNQASVELNLNTLQNYIDAGQNGAGISSLQGAHLKVQSTGGFKVLATASQDLTNTAGGTIPASDIFLTVSNPQASQNASVPTSLSGNAYNNSQALAQANTAVELFHSSQNDGTMGTAFDVTYGLKNVSNIINLNKGTYTTTIMYTIQAN